MFKAFYKRTPDKYDVMKIKLNIFCHILLLGIRFPGEVEEPAKEALTSAMDVIRKTASRRLQRECTDALRQRLVDLMNYHDLVVSHLQNQTAVLTLPFSQPTLTEIKMLTLPSGASLPLDSDSDSEIDETTDEDNELGDAKAVTSFSLRAPFIKKPRKRQRKEHSEKHQDDAKEPNEEKKQGAVGCKVMIKGHRTIRKQLQFLVQHKGDTKVIAETNYVFDRPELMDEYLGEPIKVFGSEYTDKGWVYKMEFSKFPEASLNIPAEFAEEFVALDDLWQACDGGELLSGRPIPQVL